jgi:hypothetical protein
MTSVPGTPPQVPRETWRPATAGILIIVAGAMNLCIGLIVSTTVGVLSGFPVLGAVGLPLIVLGTVSMVGGFFALRRELWGLALAGGICAVVWPSSLLGILAIIFLAISRREFK